MSGLAEYSYSVLHEINLMKYRLSVGVPENKDNRIISENCSKILLRSSASVNKHWLVCIVSKKLHLIIDMLLKLSEFLKQLFPQTLLF